MNRWLRILATVCLAALPISSVSAAETPAGISLFDGKTLDGWDGNPKFWSVKDGVITGQTTPDNPTKGNTFLIWKKGIVSDFVLDLDFRIVGGNSGIQYRSKNFGKWVIGGYQADFDAPGKFAGILYEEKGRGILALTGKKVVIDEKGEKKVVGEVGKPDAIRAAIKKEQWNHYTIIAKGNHIVHKINGVVTVDVTDNQEDKRSMSGLLALQLHQGPPMLVQFRNIYLKPDKTGVKKQSVKAKPLFNGKDLTGWTAHAGKDESPDNVWTVQDGILKCAGEPRGYLRTNRDDLADYVLTLEWRWPGEAGGNNGVLVHTSTPAEIGVWPKSIEVQLRASDAGDFWVIGTELDVTNEEQRKKNRRHINLTDDSEKPLGEWNKMEITCTGDEVIVRVNGVLVNHATNCNVTQGAICLQSEGTPIEFRNIAVAPSK